MLARSLMAAAVVSALLPLVACGSEYENCRDDAVNEMGDIQKDRIDNGDTDGSIKRYYNEQQSYADEQCADLAP